MTSCNDKLLKEASKRRNTDAFRPASQRGTGKNPSTDFQMHVSQMSLFDNVRHKVRDFTERRLLALCEREQNSTKKLEIAALIDDYRKGNLAIAWRRGSPIFVRVIQDK